MRGKSVLFTFNFLPGIRAFVQGLVDLLEHRGEQFHRGAVLFHALAQALRHRLVAHRLKITKLEGGVGMPVTIV